MRRDDLFAKPKPEKPATKILFAGCDYLHFTDECFVIADGVDSLPHARDAEKLTAETALLAYKIIRARPYYWKEKLFFLKRIFRSTNLRLWQTRRDPGYENGMASSLTVLLVINNYFWLGTAGNCNAFLYRDGLIDVIAKRDVDGELEITRAVGFSRNQLIPNKHSENLLENDMILLATDSVAGFVSEDEMRAVFEETGTTQESLNTAADALMTTAKKNGSTDKMSVCIVKRIMV